MARLETQVDVLVLGSHPAAYLAAALLRFKTKFRILHATIPEEAAIDRLVLVNPKFFELHPLLDPVRRKLTGQPIYGLHFLTDDTSVVSEYRSKSGLGLIMSLKDIRIAMRELAESQGVEFLSPRSLEAHRADETSVELSLGDRAVRPTALVVAGPLRAAQQRMLSIPEEWERGVLHRYTYVRLKPNRAADMGTRPLMPMALDLKGILGWGWLLPSPRGVQVAVEQSGESIARVPPAELLGTWFRLLTKHGMLRDNFELDPRSIEGEDLPLSGALAHEGVANRTLLIGPAGGFYSASSEDVYPNCWSAVFAADVMKKALKERHLQDALQAFRQRWRTTLGDYLRGPQQNLRYLLPHYRNQMMTNRLAEAILTGKSVVR